MSETLPVDREVLKRWRWRVSIPGLHPLFSDARSKAKAVAEVRKLLGLGALPKSAVVTRREVIRVGVSS